MIINSLSAPSVVNVQFTQQINLWQQGYETWACFLPFTLEPNWENQLNGAQYILSSSSLQVYNALLSLAKNPFEYE
jgi:hypothetical protein